MAFFTRGELLARQPLSEAVTKAARFHNKVATDKYFIFLSHSHQDGNLLEEVAALLGEYSIHIYIDWKDGSMPTVTSPETARQLKHRIAAAHKFILLATNNALASRWVPWELGVADQSRTMKNVLIFPVTDPPHAWNGNEYIGIYSYVDKRNSTDDTIQNQPAVIDPETGKGMWLEKWLTQE